jgi:hypothetical protein
MNMTAAAALCDMDRGTTQSVTRFWLWLGKLEIFVVPYDC